jgi:divalent metal cation (Fe/Co/Zn/Cd) transporter
MTTGHPYKAVIRKVCCGHGPCLHGVFCSIVMLAVYWYNDSVKDIKARAHGNFILVDLTIMVDEMLNVKDSHLITEEIEQRMNVKHSIEHVHIHIEPYVKKIR